MGTYIDYGHVRLFYEHYIALMNLRSAVNSQVAMNKRGYVPEVNWNYIHQDVLYDLWDMGLLVRWQPDPFQSPYWNLSPFAHFILDAIDNQSVISIGNNPDVTVDLDAPEKPDNWRFE